MYSSIYTLYIYAHTHIHSVIYDYSFRGESLFCASHVRNGRDKLKEGLFWRYKGFCRFCYRGRQGIKVGLGCRLEVLQGKDGLQVEQMSKGSR